MKNIINNIALFFGYVSIISTVLVIISIMICKMMKKQCKHKEEAEKRRLLRHLYINEIKSKLRIMYDNLSDFEDEDAILSVDELEKIISLIDKEMAERGKENE